MNPVARTLFLSTLAGVTLLLGGCGARGSASAPTPAAAPAASSPTATANPAPAAESLATGPWRGVLTLPGGELPFTLELANENGALVGYLANGEERLRVPETRLEGGVLTMRMPGFENTLTAKIEGNALRGELLMIKSGAKRQLIPFEAKSGEDWRFFADEAPGAANVAGRWAVDFTDQDGKSYRAVGEFRQSGARVTGTFLTPTGDHRFLAGEMRGRTLHLSVFDGGHAFLYRGTLGDDGRLNGDYWSGLAWHEAWIARRDEAASLGNSESATQLRAGQRKLDFTFPDLDGRKVSLSDKEYRGKVVIVALAGSWCPNCHDEAAFLADYYRRNRERGLEVVSLMFEQFGDFPQAVEATRRFRKEFGIEYATLIAGISDKDDAGTRLPQLNKIHAFPTTLFIGRDGTVRDIHTGFSGPATGEHYRQLIAGFEAKTEKLLAERSGH